MRNLCFVYVCLNLKKNYGRYLSFIFIVIRFKYEIYVKNYEKYFEMIEYYYTITPDSSWGRSIKYFGVLITLLLATRGLY